MIVSEPGRVLFVHVQKAAGTSVARLLLDHVDGAQRDTSLRGRKHATLPTILQARPAYGDFFIFGFVRNPWARMLSWYLMIQRRAGHPDLVAASPFWRGVLDGYPDFESFVMRAPEEFDRLARPQLDYLRAGGRRADFIGRTESFDQDLAVIRDRLGLPRAAEEPRFNHGMPRPYQDHFTPAMRDRVGELFASDVEEFGYTFD